MKLLLVEDDPTLAEGIAEFLRGQRGIILDQQQLHDPVSSFRDQR